MIEFDKPFNVVDRVDYNNEVLNVPIMLFLSSVEDVALEQMYNIARLPFAFHHIAGMPDMHLGYGMPIGGVMASKGYIVPNAVGMDIGCGMCAIRTSLFAGSLDKTILKKIMGDIRSLIPVGFKHNKEKQEGMPKLPKQDLGIVHLLNISWELLVVETISLRFNRVMMVIYGS